MKRSFSLRAVAAAATALVAGIAAGGNAAAADEMIGFGKETFQVNLGYYRPNFTTNAAIGVRGSSRPPASVSGEDDLGLDNSLGVGRLDGFWRFGERHRLYFGYYNLDRSTSGVLNKNIGPIQIPALGVNDTILAGSNVKAEGKWDVYILGYGYSFYKTNTVEIAGTLGFNVARIATTLSGTLNTLNNGVLSGATAGTNSSVTAPLPALGVSGNWALNERWLVRGNIGGFKANISDVDATVTNFSLATEYRLMRNFGLGAAYNLFRVTADVAKPDYSGSLEWRTGGWQLYGSFIY